MEQRFSLITLGFRSVEASAAFFERLGWRRSVKAAEGVQAKRVFSNADLRPLENEAFYRADKLELVSRLERFQAD
jgi:hypothetical protein